MASNLKRVDVDKDFFSSSSDEEVVKKPSSDEVFKKKSTRKSLVFAPGKKLEKQTTGLIGDASILSTSLSSNVSILNDTIGTPKVGTNDVQFNVTSSRNSSAEMDTIMELKTMVATLLEETRDLKTRINVLENKFDTSSEKKKRNDIIVPNDVRYHVKLAYKEGYKQNIPEWKMDNALGAFHEENRKTTTYIRNFVVALHPTLPNRDSVVNVAIKTYYESKRSQERKKRNNPTSQKTMARNQRRVHKARRRRKTLEHMKSNIMKEEEKVNFAKALVPDTMSSEDEKEDDNGSRYFIVKKPSWRTKKFQKLVDVIDDEYIKSSSKRSKEQMVRRVEGTPSKRHKPDSLEFGYHLFVSNSVQ